MHAKNSNYFYVVCFLSISIFCWIQSGTAPHPDTTWLMLCAQRLLDGGQYYFDFVEVNPPASILLHVPIIQIGEIFSAPLYKIPFYYFSLLCVVSLGLCLCLKKKYLEQAKQHDLYTVIAFSFLTMLLVLPGMHFGQRDYMLFIALLPTIFAFTLKMNNFKPPKFLEWFCYLWSSIFLILKPHF